MKKVKLHVSDMLKTKSNSNTFLTNSNPLFSCIVTLHLLVLLYFPQSLKLSLSPLILVTSLTLLCLLRLGAKQRLVAQKDDELVNASEKHEVGSFIQERSCVFYDEPGLNQNSKPDFDQYFIGWNVKAPLEVIYEAYEGEDEDDHSGNEIMNEKDDDRGFEPKSGFGLEKFSSLSMYYPETDSDSSSESDFPVVGYWDSAESVCFKWEEEDREGSLIEIALDHSVKKDSDFHFEEDNLIEIDISDKNDLV